MDETFGRRIALSRCEVRVSGRRAMAAKKSKKSTPRKSLKNKPLSPVKSLRANPPDPVSRIS
jgi:hypothetical protein